MSNEAQAGESSTTSPARASERATATASCIEAGVDARHADRLEDGADLAAVGPDQHGLASRGRGRPAASGPKSCPLPLPPAIRITGSVKLSSALIVEATLVPFESL